MPIDQIATKVISDTTTLIAATAKNMLILFKLEESGECTLFFVFEFEDHAKIIHLKLRKESQTKKLQVLAVLSSPDGDLAASLIDIMYENYLLNMTYEVPYSQLKGPLLTGHMSSLFANDVWYLSIDSKLYILDFMSMPGKAKSIFDTDSILSPIIKLNRLG